MIPNKIPRTIVPTLKTSIAKYEPTGAERVAAKKYEAVFPTQQSFITPDDSSIYYRLQYSHLVFTQNTFKNIFHEYYDLMHSYDAIAKQLNVPKTVIKQIIDSIY